VSNGVIRAARGGNFWHGFASGATSSYAGSLIRGVDPASGFAIATIVGGATEAVSGGNFSDGAITGAYVYLFNHLAHGDPRKRQMRRWRRRNRSRVWNGSPFDERGRELLGRWLDGSGKDLVAIEGVWGEYMMENDLLSAQILEQLQVDAKTRTSSGRFWIDFHPEIENGYQTGYEMLHGPHEFSISGIATVTEKGIIYEYNAAWFDRIDPNFDYEGDRFYSNFADLFWSPKDYNIYINWNNRAYINR